MKFQSGLKVVIRITLVLLICICVIVHCAPFGPADLKERPHLTLFEHENQQGKKYHQDVGPRCYNLPKVFDDQASSLNTHHKCIKVCARRDCKKCIKMAPGTPGHFALSAINLNDEISSFTQC